MIDLCKEVHQAQKQPSKERIRALKRTIPLTSIQAVLRKTGKRWRVCKCLPGQFLVWLVIGMGLFARDCYRQIYRSLTKRKNTPNRSTLCEARHSLGVAPLRLLAEETVSLLANPKTPGSFYRHMRMMAIDGFVLNLPDTAELERIFGRPKSGRADGAFPQARVVALCEVGTHVLWRWQIKPISCGEVTMTPVLLRHLQADMLLMWDRGFLKHSHVVQVRAQQAHLLARIKSNHIFEPLERLHDGSFLAKLYPSSRHREKGEGGIKVRILEYTFNDPNRPGAGVKHRLLTTLLDWRTDPAKTLIELYHQRWEIELSIDELKTHQKERPTLRSQTAAGVVQEIHGLLLAHYVVRKTMVEAAKLEEIDPRRLSFTATLKIIRCRLPECRHRERSLQRWYRELLKEVATEKLPPRRDRLNPRVVKQKMSKFAKKRKSHRQTPQPTKSFRRSIEMLN